MHFTKTITISTLAVVGVQSSPILPALLSSPIVAHILNEAQVQAPQEMVMLSSNPRSAFIDPNLSHSSSLEGQQEPSSLGIGFTRPIVMQKTGPNIQKHVLLEITVPGIKRSDDDNRLDSSDFYTLKVEDLQKGPFHPNQG